MIVTWKQPKCTNELFIGKNNVSEELLDEKIETHFKLALHSYSDNYQKEDEVQLENSYSNFYRLVVNPRLQALATDRHKVVLFESYFHLAKIMGKKRLLVQALKFYLAAVKIRENHKECWFNMGEIFYSQGSPETPQYRKKALD